MEKVALEGQGAYIGVILISIVLGCCISFHMRQAEPAFKNIVQLGF